MNSIEFTINKNSKQYLNDLKKIKEFIGDKSIFINNNKKILIDITIDKLKISISKLPILQIKNINVQHPTTNT